MTPTSIRYRRALLMCVLIATLVLYLGASSPLLARLELMTLDWRFAQRGPRKPGSDVVLVTIDSRSLAELGGWPWPRSLHGALVRALRAQGAAVIAFDLAFTEPQNVREDREFAAAIREAGNVILPAGYYPFRAPSGTAAQATVELRDDTRFRSSEAMARISPQTPRPAPGWLGPDTIELFWALPIPVLLEAASGAGFINLPTDADARLRRGALLMPVDNGRVYPHLALAAAARRLGVSARHIRPDTAYRIHLGRQGTIPVSREGTMPIDFAGPAAGVGRRSLFPSYSYSDVLRLSLRPPRGRPREPAAPIPRNAFQGKVVLVGATAASLFDLQATPFTNRTAGVETNANLANTILERRFIREPEPWLLATLVLLIGFGMGRLLGTSSMMRATLSTLGASLAYTLLALWLFTGPRVVLPLASPLFAIVFCYAWVMAYWFQTEYRERLRLRTYLDRYVTREVAERILSDPAAAALGGHRTEISVLFCDIRDFNAIAPELHAEEVVAVLNIYFDVMEPSILAQNGTLMQYVGDEIMSVWGAPVAQPDHARRAVRAGLGIAASLRALEPTWRENGLPPLALRIGVNSGPVVAGNVGTHKRSQYAVVGDTVNTASRLKTQNDELGTSMIISAATYDAARDLVEARPLPPISVKGKAEPLTAYEVLGPKGALAAPAAAPGGITRSPEERLSNRSDRPR